MSGRFFQVGLPIGLGIVAVFWAVMPWSIFAQTRIMELTFAPEPPDVTILADGAWCGTIDAPRPAIPGWRIRFMVEGPDFQGAPYHWITMRRIHDDAEQAIASMESIWPALQRQHRIWREKD